jgi:S-adenosylmethionine:tRNA ribosyltransferase-isomerase
MTVLAFQRRRAESSRAQTRPPRAPTTPATAASVTFSPARTPRSKSEHRLLALDPESGSFSDHAFDDFPSLLAPRDVLVVNDAATLPASLHTRDGSVELRLLAAHDDDTFSAVALGAGDYRTPTELRPAPRAFVPGERVEFSALSAEIVHVDRDEPRLVRLRFEERGSALLRGLYASAKPVQYAYSAAPFELWDVQNTFSARPWAFELPSASRPITFDTLSRLRRRGVDVRSLTHAAGLSSTGSEALDRRLPLPERSDIPESTVRAVLRARATGGRVIAAGTTVVRALESRIAERGALVPGEGVATLVLRPDYRPALVDGVLTGMHAPGTSHFALLGAFAEESLLARALEHAAKSGYLEHEFGDSMLILGTKQARAA